MHHFRTLKEIESQSSDQQQAADEASSTAEAAEQTRQQERAAAEARRHAAAQEQAHSRERRRQQERAAAEARRHAAAQEQAHSRERGRRQERAAEEPRSPVAAAETDQDKPPDKQRIFYLETLDAFELLESQGKLTPEESARLKTMRLTRSDYLDMAHRKLSGNPDTTDNEIRDLSEWLFYDRDPDGYQKYKTDQVLTEARRLYEEAGLRDAQDIGDLRAYAPSRAERGHKTLARDVLQGVGLLSDDPDEAHKQVEEWGRYIWSVLSPMGFNRDYHLAQAEHDRSLLHWIQRLGYRRWPMAGPGRRLPTPCHHTVTQDVAAASLLSRPRGPPERERAQAPRLSRGCTLGVGIRRTVAARGRPGGRRETAPGCPIPLVDYLA